MLIVFHEVYIRTGLVHTICFKKYAHGPQQISFTNPKSHSLQHTKWFNVQHISIIMRMVCALVYFLFWLDIGRIYVYMSHVHLTGMRAITGLTQYH